MLYKYPPNFARFYDVIYHRIRNGVDNQFFQDHIKKAKGKVLEIGVGTGRFFIEALKNGADIYGIDISESMVEVLKAKLSVSNRHRVSIHNIEDFQFDFQFDLIIAPFRVFMHLLEKESQLKALDNIYRHLAPKGRFIFDAFVPDLQQLVSGLDRHTDFDEEFEPGNRLKRTVTTKPDLINQIIHIHFLLEWNEGEKKFQEEWQLPLRFFFRFELEHLIERSQFDSYSILGDYQGHKLSNRSKEFVVVCRK